MTRTSLTSHFAGVSLPFRGHSFKLRFDRFALSLLIMNIRLRLLLCFAKYRTRETLSLSFIV